MNLCVVCQERKARARGPECRRCYKTEWSRQKRAQEKFERSHVSLDSAVWELNRKWYNQWYQED